MPARRIVLVEGAWVLDAVDERTAKQIALAVDMLLNHKDLTLQHTDVVVGALEHFRRRPVRGFSDCSFSRSRARRDTCRSLPSAETWVCPRPGPPRRQLKRVALRQAPRQRIKRRTRSVSTACSAFLVSPMDFAITSSIVGSVAIGPILSLPEHVGKFDPA